MATSLAERARSVLPASWWNAARFVRSASELAWRDIRYDFLGQAFPLKPRGLSLMANDICNAKCVMCSIWGRKRDRELSPDALGKLIRDPLFSELRYVGITGGEPTLRRDLPDLYRAVIDNAPRLRGASIITNAIKGEQVCERVLASAELCRERGIGFSVMVSLDGLGEVHDLNRGRPGNFASSLACIERFVEEGLPTSIGCTVTKLNVQHVDSLLCWAVEQGIPARFRVAEFIDRLYNEHSSDVIRSFSPLERYHLAIFFRRLARGYEPNASVRETYESIVGMLAEGRSRSSGCSHQTDTVVVTSRGELLYCSPKSRVLGDLTQAESAAAVYRQNIHERRRLMDESCDDCIHDYHAPVSFRTKLSNWVVNQRLGWKYDCARLAAIAGKTQPAAVSSELPIRSALVVGWYGTETAGDKAILWQVIRALTDGSLTSTEITIASFTPWVTRWTLGELGLTDVGVVATYSADFEQLCEQVDAVVLGGGPIMDLEGLNCMLYATQRAASRGRLVHIHGCGLGPLKEPRYRAVAAQLLRLATRVELRDNASRETAESLANVDAVVIEDPAAAYVRHWMEKSGVVCETDSPVVSCFLRELPRVYAAELEDHVFEQLSKDLRNAFVDYIIWQVKEHGARVNLLAMNTLVDGGDDRVFAQELAAAVRARKAIDSRFLSVPAFPMSPQEILTELAASNRALCMRYHSVLFANTLDVPFVALDYTRGGKIEGYLRDAGRTDALMSLTEFVGREWK